MYSNIYWVLFDGPPLTQDPHPFSLFITVFVGYIKSKLQFLMKGNDPRLSDIYLRVPRHCLIYQAL
jgi:hypothetical protein